MDDPIPDAEYRRLFERLVSNIDDSAPPLEEFPPISKEQREIIEMFDRAHLRRETE